MSKTETLDLNRTVAQDGFWRDDEMFDLSAVEIETVRRAAVERQLPFDPTKTNYSRKELSAYGIVREAYTREELRARGIVPGPVSSLDPDTEARQALLPIGAPFANGVQKFELPIDMLPLRVAKVIFPPGSVVRKHVHPRHSIEAPGGGLRIVVSGSILYEGREYRSGDWFFVPNGQPYEFTTDVTVPTILFYKYAFFGVAEGNRFSHPMEVE
jgi:hypothetical protein